jgi:hypothetical protein
MHDRNLYERASVGKGNDIDIDMAEHRTSKRIPSLPSALPRRGYAFGHHGPAVYCDGSCFGFSLSVVRVESHSRVPLRGVVLGIT